MLLLVAAATAFASACTNVVDDAAKRNANTVQSNEGGQTGTAPEATETDQPGKDAAQGASGQSEESRESGMNKQFLFADIPEYDGTNEISITLDGKETKAAFQTDPINSPFGFFIPSVLERQDFEDGSEWSFESRNRLTLLKFDQFGVNESELKRTNDLLLPYAEYVGSQPEGGDSSAVMTSYFAFDYNGEKYGICFRYFKDDEQRAVPLFLEVIRTIRHVTLP
ncbi:hypothetical protein [Paenibacillus beijingensis]|nr:hypothetical protein [Paenibacillus beijingensis]